MGTFMPHEYFSERENGPRPRVIEEISLPVWKGIHTVILKWYLENALSGTDHGNNELFENSLSAEIPTLSWSLSSSNKPSRSDILDLIEFSYKNVLRPTKDHYEEYSDCSQREKGQLAFREDINIIFRRNGSIYELSGEGKIIRLVPEEFRQPLLQTEFNTGDVDLDILLNTARTKFLNSDPHTRKDSLEKLWDAWERLKTIVSCDKQSSIKTLLDKTAPETNFNKRLDTDAHELTEIGNQFRIRHHEIDKISIVSDYQVDYLFFRMFNIIYLILKSTNRIK
ncbi:AbiJ-NTD4 domain-containing protein [Methanoregula sp. UBA64]|jgi:hypothetical protein|uniref:AbiJ-NTD4 domain-containing protein n=1 Tax=Methanoregula sp. UBA64 TaxID=1915554 RepID=UPI0025D014AF|nr:hypothetical protein [Methanoregula sp. UBA64]